MELSEFVEKSLNQIIDGVINAQKYAQEKGASVNPFGLDWKQEVRGQNLIVNTRIDQEFELIPQMIDFDVAVTVTEGGETKAGIGVFAGAIGIGTQAKIDDTNTKVSRIKFTIPVTFPPQKIKRLKAN